MCGGWRRVSIDIAQAGDGCLSCRRGAHRGMDDERVLRRTKRVHFRFLSCVFLMIDGFFHCLAFASGAIRLIPL